jgi:hypothetical protein
MQALAPDAISANLIGFDYRVHKWVEISMQGGSYRFIRQKRPRIDIITYAPNREDAYDLGATAQAVMMKYQGAYTAFGLIYAGCQVETDMFRDYDKQTNAVRYIQALRIILKSAVSI